MQRVTSNLASQLWFENRPIIIKRAKKNGSGYHFGTWDAVLRRVFDVSIGRSGKWITLSEFACGHEVQFVAVGKLSAHEAHARARDIANRFWNIIWNCETAAYNVANGEYRSDQLIAWSAAAVLLLVATKT